jgi:hypothetical protein
MREFQSYNGNNGNQGRKFNNFGPSRGGFRDYRNGNSRGSYPFKSQTQSSNMIPKGNFQEKENRPDNN